MKLHNDKEKIEAILSLLTDSNVGYLVNDGALEGEKEEFGAMVFASYAFYEAYKIAREETSQWNFTPQ